MNTLRLELAKLITQKDSVIYRGTTYRVGVKVMNFIG